MTDRVLVWGAGAIGATVEAFLKRAGRDITLLRDHFCALAHVRFNINPVKTSYTTDLVDQYVA